MAKVITNNVELQKMVRTSAREDTLFRYFVKTKLKC